MLAILSFAAAGVLHPIQPATAEQRYRWNVTLSGGIIKTFEVKVHPDW